MIGLLMVDAVSKADFKDIYAPAYLQHECELTRCIYIQIYIYI